MHFSVGFWNNCNLLLFWSFYMQRSKNFATAFTVSMSGYWNCASDFVYSDFFFFRFQSKIASGISKKPLLISNLWICSFCREIPKLAQWCEPWKNCVERKVEFLKNKNLYSIHICLEMQTCSRDSVQILPNWNVCYWQIYRNYTYIILHCPNFLIHIVNFAQNKINDVTLCTLRTGIVYYQLILWGVFTIFEFHTFIFGFTTTLLYNNDRIRLKWTVQTLQLNYGLSIF